MSNKIEEKRKHRTVSVLEVLGTSFTCLLQMWTNVPPRMEAAATFVPTRLLDTFVLVAWAMPWTPVSTTSPAMVFSTRPLFFVRL